MFTSSEIIENVVLWLIRIVLVCAFGALFVPFIFSQFLLGVILLLLLLVINSHYQKSKSSKLLMYRSVVALLLMGIIIYGPIFFAGEDTYVYLEEENSFWNNQIVEVEEEVSVVDVYDPFRKFFYDKIGLGWIFGKSVRLIKKERQEGEDYLFINIDKDRQLILGEKDEEWNTFILPVNSIPYSLGLESSEENIGEIKSIAISLGFAFDPYLISIPFSQKKPSTYWEAVRVDQVGKDELLYVALVSQAIKKVLSDDFPQAFKILELAKLRALNKYETVRCMSLQAQISSLRITGNAGDMQRIYLVNKYYDLVEGFTQEDIKENNHVFHAVGVARTAYVRFAMMYRERFTVIDNLYNGYFYNDYDSEEVQKKELNAIYVIDKVLGETDSVKLEKDKRRIYWDMLNSMENDEGKSGRFDLLEEGMTPESLANEIENFSDDEKVYALLELIQSSVLIVLKGVSKQLVKDEKGTQLQIKPDQEKNILDSLDDAVYQNLHTIPSRYRSFIKEAITRRNIMWRLLEQMSIEQPNYGDKMTFAKSFFKLFEDEYEYERFFSVFSDSDTTYVDKMEPMEAFDFSCDHWLSKSYHEKLFNLVHLGLYSNEDDENSDHEQPYYLEANQANYSISLKDVDYNKLDENFIFNAVLKAMICKEVGECSNREYYQMERDIDLDLGTTAISFFAGSAIEKVELIQFKHELDVDVPVKVSYDEFLIVRDSIHRYIDFVNKYNAGAEFSLYGMSDLVLSKSNLGFIPASSMHEYFIEDPYKLNVGKTSDVKRIGKYLSFYYTKSVVNASDIKLDHGGVVEIKIVQ